MAVEVWETLKESITVYTGLSPATFFTVVALGMAIYYVLSSLFGSSDNQHHARPRDFEEEMQPLPPPVQLGEITEEELKDYDGADPKKPLLMAIKGQIYDVSQSRMFYGPGGPYALFAGKDASRALAKMSFEDKDLNGDLTGLGVFELEALQDWEYKFMSKYVKVGTVKQTVPVTDESTATASTEPTEAHDPNVTGLGVFELEALQDWEYKFMSKYVKVGTVKQTVPVTDESTATASTEPTEAHDPNAKSDEDAPSENVDAEPKETTTAGEANKE